MNSSSKILIVEDEAITALNLRKNLEEKGYVVTGIATSGEQAFRKTEENIPDLILMDIKLDGNIDGIAAVKQLKSKYNIPVVYLTAHGDESTFSRARVTEPNGYLVKPIVQNELFSAIEIALNRHYIENNLRQDQVLMNHIAATSPLPIVAYNRQGIINYANIRAEELLGLKKKHITDNFYTEPEWTLLDGNGNPVHNDQEPYNIIMLSKQPLHSLENIIEWPDGRRLHVQVSGAPVFDAYGEVSQVVFNFTDITESKEREEELNYVLNHANDVIAIIQDNAIIKFINEKSLDMTGYTPGELIGTGIDSLVHKSKREDVIERYYRKMAGEHVSHVYETILQSKNGKQVEVEINGGVINYKGRDADLVVIRDITERKRTEELLHETNQLNQEIISNASEGIIVTDKNMNCILCNNFMEKLTGFDMQSIDGRHLFDIFPFLRSDEIEALLNSSLKGKTTYTPDVSFKYTGHSGWLSFLFGPHRNSKGKIIGVIGLVRDITDRKKAEEAFLQSEEKFKQLIETMNVGFSMHDKSGVCTYVNDAFCELLEYKKEDIIGSNLERFVHEDSMHDFHNRRAMKKKGDVGSFEIIWKSGSGKKVYTLFSPRQQLNNKGKYSGTFAVITDITKGKSIEQQLRENEKRLKAAQQIGRIGNWSFDCKSGEIFLSDEMYRLFGYEPGDFEPSFEFIKEHIPANDFEKLEKAFQESLNDRTEFNAGFCFHLKDEKKRYGQVIGEIVRDKKKKPIACEGVFRDVTVWKQSEDSLQWELQLNKVLATVSEALISHSWSFSEILAIILNEAKKLTLSAEGFIAEMVDGKMIRFHSFSDIFSDYVSYDAKAQYYSESIENIKKVEKKLYALLSNKNAFYKNNPVSFAVPGKEPFECSGHLSVPALAGKNILAQIVLVNSSREYEKKDLVAVKRLAELVGLAVSQSRIENQMLKSLNEKETLLKEIHHRVKNNMQIISSLLSLQSEYVKDKRDLVLFDESQGRIRSMALVHEKLYKSNDFTQIDFEDYLESITSELGQLYSEKAFGVAIDIVAKDIILHIDQAIPCALIINELLTNALKHAFDGLKTGRIVISISKNRNDIYSLVVEDNGIGIPKDVNVRKLDSLGLQLVYELVVQLRGKFIVSRKNGTRITVRFHPTEDLEAISPDIMQDGYIPHLRLSEKILIVEDERITAMHIKKVLESSGYNVIGVVVSGEEAIRSIENEVPDLVLMDIVLDGPIDGIDTVKKIKSMHDIPIVFSTANTDDLLMRKAIDTTPSGYIKKPVVKEELLAAIRHALDKSDFIL